MDYYQQGIDLANNTVKANMLNFEYEDNYACLAFSCKQLINLGFEQYNKCFSIYRKKALGDLKYASDPLLSEDNEDRLLGFCARVGEIQKLSMDGYFYHKVLNREKRTFDYVLETA